MKKHNEQSVRVVTKLENGGEGLNLTKEVINGILQHSGLGTIKDIITLEGVVVKYSDKMAYLNHDIDDSIRAGLLDVNKIPKEIIKVLGSSSTERLNTLISDFIKTSTYNLAKGKKEVGLSNEVNGAMVELRKFMFQNIYLGDTLKVERNKGKFILQQLIEYFEKYPYEMPKLYIDIVEKEGLKNKSACCMMSLSAERKRITDQEELNNMKKLTCMMLAIILTLAMIPAIGEEGAESSVDYSETGLSTQRM